MARVGPGPVAATAPPTDGAAGGGEGEPSKARVLVFTSLGHFINDGMVFFVPVIAAILAKDHGTSSLVITAMLTVFYLASAGFGLVVGLIADSMGRRAFLIALGLFVLSLGLMGFYFSLVAPVGYGRDLLAIVAALIAGIGSSFYHPLGGSLLQLTFRDASKGRALGINGSFGSVGRALYPSLFFVVAALAISQTDAVAIFGGLGILAAGAVASGLKVPAHGALPTGTDAGGTGIAVAPVGGGGPVGPGPDRPAQRRHPIRSVLNRSVVALMVIAFFRSVAFIGIVSWIPIYLSTQKHIGVSSQLGYTVTIMYVGGILGQPTFGLLADRFDKRMVLALNSLGSAAATFLYLSSSGSAATVFLLIFGFFTFSGFPLLLSLVSDYVPREASTTGNALVWGLGSTGGQAMGPLAVSLLTLGSYDHLGFAFGVLAGVAAATVLGTPLMARTARHGRVPLFG